MTEFHPSAKRGITRRQIPKKPQPPAAGPPPADRRDTEEHAAFMRKLYATLLFEHECISREFRDQDPPSPKGNQPSKPRDPGAPGPAA